MERIASTVADSSTLRREESRSPAQVCRSCPNGNVRSRSRRPSGALVTSACRAEMARVRNVIACARVASSTRMASRSPRRRGSLRPTPASACRAARTASMSSLFTPPRRAGRCGRSTSTTRSQRASSAVVSPAPKLPVPSMAHNRRVVAPPEARSAGGSRPDPREPSTCSRTAPVALTAAAVWVSLMGVDADDDVKISMEGQHAVRSFG